MHVVCKKVKNVLLYQHARIPVHKQLGREENKGEKAENTEDRDQ
jgi:hypothetical protein